MASIREVAKLAHVAPSTVSRALNGSGYVSEESKSKIKKAVEELDYIPNQWIRNLYKKRTGIIGVMTPDIIHPYFSTLWNYLEAELDQYGYNVVICNTRENQDKEREYLDTLERNLFDGLIVGSAFLPDQYYTNIEIQPGDTLWDLAEDYMGDQYESRAVYVAEVRQINGIADSDSIVSGQYLIMPYYSAEYK